MSNNNESPGKNTMDSNTLISTALTEIEDTLNNCETCRIEIVSAMKEIGREDDVLVIWYGVEVYLMDTNEDILKCVRFPIEITKDRGIMNEKTITIRQRLWKLTRLLDKYIERRINTILFVNMKELAIDKYQCTIKRLLYPNRG